MNTTTGKHQSGRPRKEINREELKRLLQEGRSLREIARILKRGYGTVYRAAKDLLNMPDAIQNPAA